MTMPLDPTLLNPGSDASVPFDQFTATYDDAIRNADSQVAAAKARYMQAESAVSIIDPNKLTSQDALKAAQDEKAKAATIVEQAQAAANRARELKGAAIERYSQRGNIPQELRDRYAAMAQVERSTAAQKQAEVAEFLNTAPNRREEVRAHTQEAVANAQVAQAKADLANATTDLQKQQAQTAVDQAVANLGRTQIDNKNAGYQSQITAAQAAVAPEIAQAQAAQARGQAAITTAQAAVAPQAAQAAVDQAQANVNKTNQEISDLQRQARQAPTDSQAAQAIQLQIQQKQTELASAQQQLQQAQQLLPGVLAQQGATLAGTQAGTAGTEASTAATLANTQKGLLGNLYGLQDKAKQIADMIRSGQITDPAQGMAQLQDYISTTIQGTTPFERNKTLLETETTRRGQDYSLAGQQGSTYGSGFSSALSTFGKLNDTIAPGSDAGGRGFIAAMNMLGDRLNSFKPASTPMDSPLLASMRPAAAPITAPAAAPPTAAPGTDTSGGHAITINIGGSGAAGTPQPPTALLAPGAAGTAADPNAAGSPALRPAFLTNQSPALPNHVADLWANDPNLNPGAMAATGAVDRTSQGRGGF